jgi:aspartate aminotransferase-like enzyme
MAVAELRLPRRLLAGGGPGAPDARVLAAMSLPVIGQFDPDFTTIMDDVMDLGRGAFMTSNARCFAVSALGSGGLEAVLNTLLEPGDTVAILGRQAFVADTADIASRYGARVVTSDDSKAGIWVAPLVDPTTCERLPIRDIATACHAHGGHLVVDATLGLGGCELRVDAWGIDVAVAGVDYCLGAPSGMALVTYTAEVEASMAQRGTPAKTSYLDLLQLQAYWSPERLNHHTAPTSLVYGLREALRLLHLEGLEASWARHAQVGQHLHDGLNKLDLEVSGEAPYAIVQFPSEIDPEAARDRLREEHDVYVGAVDSETWRIGLLGADATLANARRVISAIDRTLVGANV